MVDQFIIFLQQQDKSSNTIKSYSKHIKDYINWFKISFNNVFIKLYRENALEYKSYLINVRRLNAKSINTVLAALIKFNEFLIERECQADHI